MKRNLSGNLEAKRDWGHAREYVKAMCFMLQQEKPDDYVIATTETHSIREFLNIAFSHVGLDYMEFVEIDSLLYRPSEVHLLQGDALKASKNIGWEYRLTFEQLVKEMDDADLEFYKIRKS